MAKFATKFTHYLTNSSTFVYVAGKFWKEDHLWFSFCELLPLANAHHQTLFHRPVWSDNLSVRHLCLRVAMMVNHCWARNCCAYLSDLSSRSSRREDCHLANIASIFPPCDSELDSRLNLPNSTIGMTRKDNREVVADFATFLTSFKAKLASYCSVVLNFG